MSLKQARAADSHVAQARYRSLLRRAEVLLRRGRYAAAYESLHGQLEDVRLQADAQAYARALKVIGVSLQGLGETARAVQVYREILSQDPTQSRAERPVSARLRADVCNNLGLIFAGLGRHDAALEQYQRSMQLDPSPPEAPARALTHNNIGLLLHDMGLPAAALTQFRTSLKIKIAADDKAGQANTLDNIGALLLDIERVRVARSCFQQALALRSSLGDSRREAGSCLLLGKLDAKVSNWPAALQQATRGLQLMAFRAGSAEYLELLLLAGQALLRLEFRESGIRTLTWLVQLADTAGLLKPAVAALDELAAAYANAGNFRAALHAQRHCRLREVQLERRADTAAARRRHVRAQISAQRAEVRAAQTRIEALRSQQTALEARRARLRRALQQREAMLEQLKYQLRTPLAELVFRAALLRRSAVLDNPAAMRQQLTTMARDCQQIQADIQRLLHGTERSKTAGGGRPTTIGQMLREICTLAVQQFGQELHLENVAASGVLQAAFTPDADLASVSVDANLMQRLRLFLLNLLAVFSLKCQEFPRVQVFVSGTFLYLFVRRGASLGWLAELINSPAAGSRRAAADMLMRSSAAAEVDVPEVIPDNAPAIAPDLYRCLVCELARSLGVVGVRRRLDDGPALALAIPLAVPLTGPEADSVFDSS